MPRPRTYATAAERQRAYRARLEARQPPAPPGPARPSRPASRPARIAALEASVRALQAEYEGWLDALPETLAHGGQVDLLQATIEQLEAAADLLAEVQPPRGFGRD